MAEESGSTIDRRRFLTVLGTTGAGAVALSGCSTERVEKLIPYLVQAEDQVPGVATWYASSCAECSTGCGLHVRTREGRAVKLEGNPEHPINRGKLCSRGQAALQGLYNPGRLTGPMARGADGRLQEITWDDAIKRLSAAVSRAGKQLAVISGTPRGTFSDLLAEWVGVLGGRVVQYEPFASEAQLAANRQVFGIEQLASYDFARAKYILSFGADFLDTWPGSIEHQRGFAQSHGFSGGEVAKFVYFAPRRNLTGLNADEWHPLPPGSEAALALAMTNVLLGERAGGNAGLRNALAGFTPDMAARETGISAAEIIRIAREFGAARPSLAVASGIGSQHAGAAEVCAAVNLLNYVAGNLGDTVTFGPDLEPGGGYGGLDTLLESIDGGRVSMLMVHDSNPAYTLPQASRFASRLQKVGFKVSTSMFLDETAALCDLLLPQHHALERWDDLRPRQGVYSLMQPVMEPVFNTLAAGDVLLRTAKQVGGPLVRFDAPSYQAHLRSRWQSLAGQLGERDFNVFWHNALQRGGVFGDAPRLSVSLAAGATQVRYNRPAFEGRGEHVLTPFPHAMLYDGRGANKPWLLENADPVTKITWHSWVEIHPETAQRLDVQNGDVLRVASPHGSIEAPAYVYPGLHPGVVAMPLGFGHGEYGEFARGRGVNPLALVGAPRSPFLPYVSTRVSVEKTGQFRPLATLEGNPRQLGRGIAEAVSLDAAQKGLTIEQAYQAEGHGKHEINTEVELEAISGWSEEQAEASQYGDYAAQNPRWGMAIDLAKCTGCEACVTACYAENNIPIVGEAEVLKGREMTWIRIERYWDDEDHGHGPNARFIPMLCQHCGNAPCEPVCPVYAAYHTADGLNGQVYNRCVGTRYCANNCPYKVRYFNWYKYNERSWPEPLHLQLNPDVTVRARGVMEKCTFCIQRIRGAQNEARLENRPLRDGDFTTACAQACPSDAIVFGNLTDPTSRVSRLQQNPRGYKVLDDLNTRPVITYLAKVVLPEEA